MSGCSRRGAGTSRTSLRILFEEDAFDQILEDWQRQGYPFGPPRSLTLDRDR